MVVTKHSPLIYITADWFTGGSVPKMLQCTSSQNKMASHRSYTSEEVLAEIFADPDSDFDGESSSDESYTEEVLSESTESSESDESDELSENDAQENTPRPECGVDVAVEVVVDGLDNTTALLDAVQEETNNRKMHC